MTTAATLEAQREYGPKVTAVEPGGVEFISLAQRHGSPIQLAWTWVSPAIGDITFEVGFVIAAALYWVLFSVFSGSEATSSKRVR